VLLYGTIVPRILSQVYSEQLDSKIYGSHRVATLTLPVPYMHFSDRIRVFVFIIAFS
jgi:hypothetical protein